MGLPEPHDIFAEVPANYPFEEQLADNAAAIADQQAQNPAPDPFAVTLDNEVRATKNRSKSKDEG